MKTLFLIFASLMAFGSTSYCLETNLICMTGDAVDMDINVESQDNGKEKISVTLTGMDGESFRIFINSKIENSAFTRGMQKGQVTAVVSKSDLEESFGGAYFDAGILTMIANSKTSEYDVSFAAESSVYTGKCSPK